MTVLDEVVLRQAFRAQLALVSGIPEKKFRAFENRVFDPPEIKETSHGDEPLWIREQMRILSETKSTSGHVEAVGEYLIMVETPKGKGTEDADTLAQAIAEKFQAGQSLTKSGTTAILEHTDRRPYQIDLERPAWVFKTVAVRWRNFTAV